MQCEEHPGDVPLAVQLVFLGHRLAHVVERRLALYDYNHTQASIIMILDRRPGLTAQDLARPVRVQPASITRALQSLERRGLVDRRPHPTDGRASVLHLTEAGCQAAATIARTVREASVELESHLPTAQRAVLRSALPLLLARVEELRGAEQ